MMNKCDWYTNVSRVGNNLYIRGIKNDKEVRYKVAYEPTLYLETDQDYGFQTVYGKNLKPLYFDSMANARDFAKEHKDTNLKIYGFPFFHSQYCLETFEDSIDKWKREQIRVWNIDIEVTSNEGFPEAREAGYPVTAVCIHDSITDKFITFGHGKWTKENSELSDELLDKTVYIECKDEYDLFNKMMRFWVDNCPQIITGWNLEFFDMPYIYNRMENLGLDNSKLSPWGRTSIREIRTARGEEQAVDIQGVDVLDYLNMYRVRKVQESYRLDHIANVELGERKLDYSEVSGLHQLYFTNFQKFIDYNIQDVNLVKRLDDKLGLIDAQIAIAYTASINYQETNGTVRTWDSLINKELFSENKIPHFHLEVPEVREGIPGGHVKEPHVGKHGWCMSFDVNSLYPHLIMQWNISPETLKRDYKLWPHESDEGRQRKLLDREPFEKPEGHCVSGAGYAYRNDIVGIMPRIMRRLYDERKVVKRKMIEKQKRGEDASLENLRQYVIKILLNSGYGAINNQYYRWYERANGQSITLSGQYIIQVAEQQLNEWMNKVLGTKDKDYIIAIDTDSNYITCQDLVDKFFSDKSRDEIVDILDKIAKEQMQKALEVGFDWVQEYMGTNTQEMVMEREAIASTAFWTAKKRYAMCVWDMEGVRMPADKPKLKIQGLEAIRSSTPQVCRQPLLDFIRMTLLEEESVVQEAIHEFKEQFKQMRPEEIAMPRTMNNVTKQTLPSGFNKGTPPHVRGAIQFNRLLQKYDIAKDWEAMKDGEKGKFIYLRLPNNVGTDVISFNTSIPEEFNCLQYIDYEKMFEKVIVDPMNNILLPIGWSVERRLDLTSFFS